MLQVCRYVCIIHSLLLLDGCLSNLGNVQPNCATRNRRQSVYICRLLLWNWPPGDRYKGVIHGGRIVARVAEVG